MHPISDARLLRRLREAQGHVARADLGDPARIQVLREAGYGIEEHPDRGYRLVSSPDRLMADDIFSRLPPCRLIREIVVLERTGSTNDFIANLARQGVPEGIVAFAEEQTAGRGRLGRQWLSQPRAGLWFSILLRPAWPLPLWTRLTLGAAWAVARGIEETTGARPMLKWPNDLYMSGRKVAGILVESSPSQENAFAVAGFGVNASQESFPDSLAAHATSLRMDIGAAPDRNELAARILEALDAAYFDLPEKFEEILGWARERDFLREKRVTVAAGDQSVEGIACGLGADGALLLKTGDSPVRRISSGEVTRVHVIESDSWK